MENNDLQNKILKLNKEKPLKENIQRVLPPADADAFEQHEQALKQNAERKDLKNQPQEVKEFIKETASEESRYSHFDVVDRKELAKRINEAKKKGLDFKVSRSMKEGFRYDLQISKENLEECKEQKEELKEMTIKQKLRAAGALKSQKEGINLKEDHKIHIDHLEYNDEFDPKAYKYLLGATYLNDLDAYDIESIIRLVKDGEEPFEDLANPDYGEMDQFFGSMLEVFHLYGGSDKLEEFEQKIAEDFKQINNQLLYAVIFTNEYDPVKVYVNPDILNICERSLMRFKLKDAGRKTTEECLKEARENLHYFYAVYEVAVDEDGDVEEIDLLKSFKTLEKAIAFAQKQDCPTHIVYVPDFDPDDHREWVNQGEYEDFEVVWTNYNLNESLKEAKEEIHFDEEEFNPEIVDLGLDTELTFDDLVVEDEDFELDPDLLRDFAELEVGTEVEVTPEMHQVFAKALEMSELYEEPEEEGAEEECSEEECEVCPECGEEECICDEEKSEEK